jgi:hypothetical protein
MKPFPDHLSNRKYNASNLMKKLLYLAFASIAAVALSNCCTTESYNVTVRTHTAGPAKPTNPEAFEAVERY